MTPRKQAAKAATVKRAEKRLIAAAVKFRKWRFSAEGDSYPMSTRELWMHDATAAYERATARRSKL